MNNTDRYVLDAIQEYYQAHGKYPPRVEVTNELLRQMTHTCFHFPVPAKRDFRLFDRVTVPVVPVGDDVAKAFIIHYVDIDDEHAMWGAQGHYRALCSKFSKENIDVAIVDSLSGDYPAYESGQHRYYRIYGVVSGYEVTLKDVMK